MDLFQLGDFTLNSGAKSRWKLECDALTPGDIEALAEMVRQMVGAFSSVEGVPRGGLRLAEALKPFAGISGPHLIVDDVLTTGGSMERTRDAYWLRKYGPGSAVKVGDPVGTVIFARGQRLPWVSALFQMPECFWLKPRTRG
jgi:hypothetical protein